MNTVIQSYSSYSQALNIVPEPIVCFILTQKLNKFNRQFMDKIFWVERFLSVVFLNFMNRNYKYSIFIIWNKENNVLKL